MPKRIKTGIPFPRNSIEYTRAYKSLRIKKFGKVVGNSYSAENGKRNRLKDPIGNRLTRIKHRSKKNNLDFNLDRSDFPEFPVCPIFNTDLTYNPDEKDIYKKASVDRIDPTKGYTKDNIKIISYKANMLKNDSSIEVLQRLLDYMVTNSTVVETVE
jgi:hypothetical protein